MAINHSLPPNIPEEALWWQQVTMNTQPSPTLDAVPAAATAVLFPGASTLGFNVTHHGDGEHSHAGSARDEQDDGMIEPMFEKPLTPSDVGKLNRLVIPKQHAEKHLPLCGDSAAADKGQLLSFEDESGKPWRFRYSYWNSSQSYVLTKGWSRFVKEKRLDAGDVILFLKHRRWSDRFFIGCRRRAVAAPLAHDSPAPLPAQFYYTPPYPSHLLPCQPVNHCPRSAVPSIEINRATAAPTAGKSKRLRLFGVNLEWQPDRFDPTGSDASPISTGSLPHQQLYEEPYSSNRHHSIDMDVNFARDVNHQTMMNRRG